MIKSVTAFLFNIRTVAQVRYLNPRTVTRTADSQYPIIMAPGICRHGLRIALGKDINNERHQSSLIDVKLKQ
jgi:hypothetical protein